MARLFGTDGVRNIAGTKVTGQLALMVGQAAAIVLTKREKGRTRPKAVIGKDTRLSCDMLEMALASGLASVGVDVIRVGVLPTPGVAYLTKKLGAGVGIMVSASHNTFEHNGIKIFGTNGKKLSDKQQDAIESHLQQGKMESFYKDGVDIGRIRNDESAVDYYVDLLAESAQTDLSGLKVVFDAANGAASTVAGKLAEKLGLNYSLIGNEPNGTNINERCGSMSPELLMESVRAAEADLGIALDGDADRILAVTETGTLLDGDQLLAILAEDYRRKGLLKDDTLVATIASNMGLHKFCEANGITLHCTDVGDRYVLAYLADHKLMLGGEQAGHIILRNFLETGDGLLAGVQLMAILKNSESSLSALSSAFTRYPQETINIRVSDKTKGNYADHPQFIAEKQGVESILGGDGRVLVRASGTEPVLRVMVEAPTSGIAKGFANKLARLLEEINIENTTGVLM